MTLCRDPKILPLKIPPLINSTFRKFHPNLKNKLISNKSEIAKIIWINLTRPPPEFFKNFRYFWGVKFCNTRYTFYQ